MPKDAKKNVDRYKLAGGHLNEFEFRKNQAQVNEPSKPWKEESQPAAAKKSASKKTRKR